MRLVLVSVAVTAVCATAATRVSQSTAPPLRTSIYFLVDGGRAPIALRRSLPRRAPPAQEALASLLRGPTSSEQSSGITSALPQTARVRRFTLAPSRGRDAGTATVDLTGVSFGTGTTARLERAATQVARTLVGTSGIRRVRLRVDGRPWPFVDHAGRVLDLPVDYRRLLAWTRVCPLAGEPTSCFSALP